MGHTTCATCNDLRLVSSALRINLAELRDQSLRDEPCPSCSLLWQCLRRITGPGVTDPAVAFTHLAIDPSEHGDRLGKGPLIAHLIPLREWERVGMKQLDLHFYASFDDPPSPWPTIGRAYPISPEGLLESSISLMRQWLDQCTAAQGRHVSCGIAGTTRLPKRLVHVGDSNTKPKLYLSVPGQTGRFAALSHCWGGKGSVRTLLSNISDHLIALPEPLPQTFADALAVARALGLDYIWIDSLCIIQDDPADWAAEAAQMAHVYANAYVTISADAAPDAEAGFLRAPSRQVPTQHRVPVTTGTITYPDHRATEAAAAAPIHVRTRGFLAEELPFHCWDTNTTLHGGRSKLSTRGWVFQERILSPRTIHFAAHETAWECRSLCDCECSATAARTKRTTSVVKHFLSAAAAATSSTSDSSPSREDGVGRKSPQVSWRHDIVQAYTRLDLTVATDRLPALAGLAEAAGRLRPAGDCYLAGLWRSSLVADMLWRVAARPGSHRLPAGCAPSWSWGSVTGAVTYDSELEAALENEQDLFVVEDVRFKEGGVPDTITARCCAIPVRVSFGVPDDLFDEVEPVGGPAGVKLSVTWDSVDDCFERRSQAIYLFVVFGTRSPRHGPFGIILGVGSLVRVDGATKKFRRLGFVDGYQPRRRLRRWDSGGWETDEEDLDPDLSNLVEEFNHKLDRWDSDEDAYPFVSGERSLSGTDYPSGSREDGPPCPARRFSRGGRSPVRGARQGAETAAERETWIRAALASARRRVEIL